MLTIAVLIGYAFFVSLAILAATQSVLPLYSFGQRVAFISATHGVNCSLAMFAYSRTSGYLAGAWLLLAVVSAASALAYVAAYALLKRQTPVLTNMIEPHRQLWGVLSVYYLFQTGIWFSTVGIPFLG